MHAMLNEFISPCCSLFFFFLLSPIPHPALTSLAIEPERVAAIMLSWHGLELVSSRRLQTLWAGYGYIYEVKARAISDEVSAELRKTGRIDVVHGHDGEDVFSLILKYITPPPTKSDSEDEGHLRKLMSYGVEQHFYSAVVPHLEDETPVAHCVATTRDSYGRPNAELLDGSMATIMSDLRLRFPVAGEKRSALNKQQVYAALDWLSSFHKTARKLIKGTLDQFLLPPLEEAKRRQNGQVPGTNLWLNGGYTYLATRRPEYATLAEDEEWSSLCTPISPDGQSIAELAASFLTPRGRTHETLIHGDVKSENLFTTKSGREVAFYDFQYVGLGFGVCDLAKLFTCSVPLELLTDPENGIPNRLQMDKGEEQLLKFYHLKLLTGFIDPRGNHVEYAWEDLIRHWETALVDWLRFQASWGFWGNTEWLEARVRSILEDQQWREWLQTNQPT
ncbi:Ecdysteroid kinase-domain-containing protein [Hypoxylon sp. FL1150]|nr:Ecdysteroid kinase-domain-containing protein [Hypoxylon sp. FL1150]